MIIFLMIVLYFLVVIASFMFIFHAKVNKVKYTKVVFVIYVWKCLKVTFENVKKLRSKMWVFYGDFVKVIMKLFIIYNTFFLFTYFYSYQACFLFFSQPVTFTPYVYYR